MRIHESGFGNEIESFVESRYMPGLNIIYSNNNNKGKTLVIQSLMYALGNDPIFPEGFDYKSFYHYVKIETKGEFWRFLRKGNNFIVAHEDDHQIISSVAELKRFLNAKLFQIPKHKKDGVYKIAELALFYQLFFLPQDLRDTSSVIGGGYFNKTDFVEMIHALAGEQPEMSLSDQEILDIKEEIKKIKDDIADQRKMLTFSKKRPEISAIANNQAERALYTAKKDRLEKVHSRISELQKKRSRETSQKIKLERLIDELRSLNRTISSGKVECGDCHSENILYKTTEFSFEVSNDYVRKNILNSIKNEIQLKDEIIEEFSRDIEREQALITKELQDTPKSVQTAMFAFDEIFSDSNIQKTILELERRLKEKEGEIENALNQAKSTKKIGKSFIERLISKMQQIYHDIDPEGSQIFEDLFSKRGVVYSGSEGMEFYLAKLLSLKSELNHEFPIIIDYFRDGELSSEKEMVALRYLVEVTPQAIITSTLKNQEYSAGIYNNIDRVNPIDYSPKKSSKILSPEFNSKFEEIIDSFSVKIQ